MEKTKFTASKKKKRKPQPNEDLRLASKSNSTVYRAWVGKAETRQPGRYKLNRTFCHLILGLQFFYPPGASIIRAQLRHKNLVTVSHPCLCFKANWRRWCKTRCVKRYASKTLRRILTSSARDHITSTAVWICVIAAFYAASSSFGFGRISLIRWKTPA